MWVKTISDLTLHPPEKFKIWMLKPKNLGEALRKVCNTLSVRVLEQVFDFPFPDEYTHLGLSRENDSVCFLRQIFLEGDGIPLTFGRVALTRSAYLNYMKDFDSLGTKLIGETLLYNNPMTTRSSFEYTNLDNRHPLFKQIASVIPDVSASFWARRSVFHMNGSDPLLLTEVFLEKIPPFLD